MHNIKRKMAKGAAWTIGFKLAHRALSLVSTIILVRLLVPADFGLVALATAFIAGIELFSAFRFDLVLIQHRDPRDSHFNTVWTVKVIFGTTIACLVLLFSKSVSGFYEEPRLFDILVVLAAGSLIRGFGNVGVVSFRKELQFHRDFLYMFLPRLAGFCITIPAAFILRSYWALIIGMLTMSFSTLISSFILSDYRPRFSLAASRELFNFSKWLFIINLTSFIRHRSSDFIIGKFSGPTALGIYSISYEVSAIPTTELVAPINRAVFPGYAKMSHDKSELRQAYLDVIGLIALFALPAAAGIAATSELLVFTLLGEKWAAATPLVSILAISGAIMAMETNVRSIYLALGRPKIMAAISTVYIAILIPMLIYLSAKHGPIGAAWAVLLSALINLPLQYGIMFRTLELRVGKFTAIVWRPLAATLIMYVLVRFFITASGQMATSIDAIPQLLVSILFGASVYAVCLFMLWIISSKPNGPESHVLDEVVRRLKARHGHE